jgi:hypothetical protein
VRISCKSDHSQRSGKAATGRREIMAGESALSATYCRRWHEV